MAFEYGVILNGSQTEGTSGTRRFKFEYGVILNGSQTFLNGLRIGTVFEYGVRKARI